MILEVAILNVKPGQEDQFENNFQIAQPLIMSIAGYIGHQVQRCVETPNRDILLVNWNRLDDHTVGFRQSSQYQEWKSLLHHFYDPFPTVEHFSKVPELSGKQLSP